MDRYGRWQDAMIAQSRLLDWSMSPAGLRYLEAFFEDMRAKRPSDGAYDVLPLARVQLHSLHGEPTYVSADACELVEHAAQTFQPEAVLPSDPWVPNGFALLAQPLYILDVPDASPTGKIPIRAVAWASVHNEDASVGCFWLSFYVDVDDEIKHAAADGVASRWQGVEDEVRREIPLSLVHQWQWTWGRSIADPDYVPVGGRGELPEEIAARSHAQAALVQTLWRIGSQFVSVKERAPRGIWRDANRKGLDRKDVTVIRLRRARDDHEYEPTGRTVGVQFPVRGYWARRHTREGVRQVWVRPHMKGPEDAPLHLTTRVWEFTR